MKKTEAAEIEARAVLLRLLRGPDGNQDRSQHDEEAFSQPVDWSGLDLIGFASRLRVHLLLAWQLRKHGALERCPQEVRDALQNAVREAALSERARAVELQANLERLAEADIHPILLKGAPLAYLCYPEPYLRPHLDLDLFIREADIASLRRVMEAAGYARSQGIEGDRIQHQFGYLKRRPTPITHAYDVHWRVANPALFAELITFAEAERSSVAIPALGPHARALGDVHALLLACVHRVAHHRGSTAPDLLWLYDIHLLAGRLTEDDWRSFTKLASDRGVRAICRAGLESATEAYDTDVPASVFADLARGPEEASAEFLRGGLREIDVQVSNFKHLHGWRAKLQLIRQNLFPEPAFMLESYKVQNPIWLPALYVHRILRGTPKWFRSAR